MTPTDPTAKPVGLLNIRQVAARLGCSERTAWAFRASGELPAIVMGGLVRFHPDDLEAFIVARRTTAGTGKAEAVP